MGRFNYYLPSGKITLELRRKIRKIVIIQCTEDEKIMLTKVNEIGMKMSTNPEDELIFIALSPYLDPLMSFLKSLDSNGMSVVFYQYGVHYNTRYLEERYYISSLEPDAQLIGQSIRKHWSIENKLHWCLDVVFDEDNCRAREGHSAENFSIVRHIVLNLLKQNKGKKTSLKATRIKAGWNDKYLLELLQAL